MKVLLYEPGMSGHRPVILRYLVKGLPAEGWVPIVCTDPKYAALRDEDIGALEQLAIENRCQVLHLLTIDGTVRNWLKPRRQRSKSRVSIVGSYYLFNNLWGIRGLVWLLASWFGYIDRILISDPLIEKRNLWPGLRKLVGFVPDPWCQEEFKEVDQQEARRRLNLPATGRLVLIFGEISKRKGVDRILSALRLIVEKEITLVFAGRVSTDVSSDINAALANPRYEGRLIVHNHHIAETDVAAYFYACDAVLSDYPRWFKVSSGAFTRALASSRCPIFPCHGVNAEMIDLLGFGRTYKVESIESLTEALEMTDSSICPESVSIEAGRREARTFVKCVTTHYNSID